MAKVLIFNNFLRPGQASIVTPDRSKLHQYTSTGPGRWRANPYAKAKHICFTDLLRRMMTCIMLCFRWRKYDVLIVDSSVTAMLVSLLSIFTKGHRKLVINNFNVPRRRKGPWRRVQSLLFRRVDFFFVHSRHDIELAAELYNIDRQRFAFTPLVRREPAAGPPSAEYLFEDGRPFILSYGGNARDYATLFKALEGAELSAVVVARPYNIDGLKPPPNVRVSYNIPLEECDRLVRECRYTVFTFDGSEPSCGQISIVTSLLLGKPVICTDWMGIEDYVTDGVNGMCVRMGDAENLRAGMLELYKDRQLHDRLSAGAREWAARNCDISAAKSKIDNLVTTLTDPTP